jgi:hypothetical protein
VTLLISVAVGLSLAASCGLRAFLPLFVLALATRIGGESLGLQVGASFLWLQSTPAIVALGVAVLVETGADKIPAIDHLLDLVQGPVRTGAGVLAAVAVTGHLPGWATALLGVVAGGGALSVHAGKAALRVGSSATTAGAANPLLSLGEDALCLATSLVTVLIGAAALCMLTLLLAAVIVIFVRRARSRRGEAPPDAPTPTSRPA